MTAQPLRFRAGRLSGACALAAAVLATVVPTALAQDWPQWGYDASHASFNPAERALGQSNVGRLHEAWFAHGMTTVAVAGDRVFAVGTRDAPYSFEDRDGELLSYSRSSGSLLWRTPVARLDGHPAVGGGLVFVVGRGVVRGFPTDCRPTAGLCSPRFEARLPDQSAWLTVAGDELYVSVGARLLAFSTRCAGACTPSWTADVGEATGPAAAARGVVYAPSRTLPGVFAFPIRCRSGGLPCAPLWRGRTAAYPFTEASPAVAGGKVVVYGRLEERDASGVLAVHGYRLEAFATGCGAAGSFCAPVWHSNLPPEGGGSSPAVADGKVYVTAGTTLFAVDLNCGSRGGGCRPLWSAKTPLLQGAPTVPGDGLASPSVANDLVYAGHADGRLYAFSADCPTSSCSPLWSVPTGGSFRPSNQPAIAGGELFTAPSGFLFAFRRDAPAPVGALTQPRGAAGCISQRARRGCRRGRRMFGLAAIAISPDGRHVYAAAPRSAAVSVFARDRASGALRQLRGRAGCVSSMRARRRCRGAHHLTHPYELALSPDGRNLYVGSAGTYSRRQTISANITVFRRNRRTGALRQLRDAHGCLGTGRGCRRLRGLTAKDALAEPGSFAFTRDGRSLYVAGPDNALRAFKRSRRSGRLRELRGRAACVTATDAPRRTRRACLRVPKFAVTSLATSPDGRNVYAGSEGSEVSLRGFARNRRTGALRAISGRRGCYGFVRGCGRIPFDSMPRSVSVVVSRDGRAVYAGGYDISASSVAAFRRNRRTGALARIRGRPGCTGTLPRCNHTSTEVGSDLTLTHDGRSAYTVGGSYEEVIVVLDRDRRSALTQKAGEWACVSELALARCSEARAIRQPVDLVLSPRGHHLYVASGSNSIAVFRRQR